jgi:hypothetical protein
MTLYHAHLFPTSDLASLSLILPLLSRPFKRTFVKSLWKFHRRCYIEVFLRLRSTSITGVHPLAPICDSLFLTTFTSGGLCYSESLSNKVLWCVRNFSTAVYELRQLSPPCMSSSICCMQKAVEPTNDFFEMLYLGVLLSFTGFC